MTSDVDKGIEKSRQNINIDIGSDQCPDVDAQRVHRYPTGLLVIIFRVVSSQTRSTLNGYSKALSARRSKIKAQPWRLAEPGRMVSPEYQDPSIHSLVRRERSRSECLS